jgi:hypothetical protein
LKKTDTLRKAISKLTLHTFLQTIKNLVKHYNTNLIKSEGPVNELLCCLKKFQPTGQDILLQPKQ